MSGPEKPRLEFPCEYPIKIMGLAGDELHRTVCTIMERHAPGFDATSIMIRDSAQGNYQALTVVIIATGEPQLRAIHADLKQSPHIKMVL